MNLFCPVPEGAFYVFPQVKSYFGKTTPAGAVIGDDVSFCQALLNEALVATVPGGAFGDAGAIRISYAGKEADLKKGLIRIADWLKTLK
jgi:aspartate aminotransferase